MVQRAECFSSLTKRLALCELDEYCKRAQAIHHIAVAVKRSPCASAGDADSGANIAVAVDFGIADQLHGALTQLTEETLSLKTAWQSTVDIPLLNVQGLCLKQASPDAKRRYDAARAKPPILHCGSFRASRPSRVAEGRRSGPIAARAPRRGYDARRSRSMLGIGSARRSTVSPSHSALRFARTATA